MSVKNENGMVEPVLENGHFKEIESVLSVQYEKRIRPCIDLIDSLRALGVEEDLALPAIAVIGDQSSGKSSVLEALSGVALPRGSGIVTRCPLELKMKKTPQSKEWTGKISYLNTEEKLNSPSQVEEQIRRAQTLMTGPGVGISSELISLDISSPNVPDLTLIDLPGIARVAVGNQPQDIGQQIVKLIKKYIAREQTINLVVVPSNVDIATTEALKMAQEVDPQGKRTLGILTKPDLIDKGTETEVLDVVRNQKVPLTKGYMIVKCRGQNDINDKVSLIDAIQKEKAFFEGHEFFRPLLMEGRATIPLVAERLTQELIEHIHDSLPTLERQIQEKLQASNMELQKCGRGVPRSIEDKMLFLIEKIRHFNNGILMKIQGEEISNPKLFTKVRCIYNKWQETVNGKAQDVRKAITGEIWTFENKYRGKELPGFISYRTFEEIVKYHIVTLESPAIGIMEKIGELVREAFLQTATQHFSSFHCLLRAAHNNIEDIKLKQEEKTKLMIKEQFNIETVVYSQDEIYSEDLKDARTDEANKPFQPKISAIKFSTDEMAYHLNAYFKSAGIRLGTQIPLIISANLLRDYAENLQNAMMQLLQNKDELDFLLQEKNDLALRRNTLKERIRRLSKARQRLVKFPA